MNIRDFANSVLLAIGQSTITDEEAVLLPLEYDEGAIYEALARILNKRGATGSAFQKLKAYAVLHNYTIGTKQDKGSNIFIGSVL